MIKNKLYEKYMEILGLRNKVKPFGLSFVFEFDSKFYYVYWNKNRWSEPTPIDVITAYMTNEQLKKDIEFLAERQLKAGAISFMGDRETGLSSNSIVSIAYGLEPLEYQRFPSDVSDMRSIENMWKKLPEHRKTGDGLKAMEAARNCEYYGKR